MEAFRACHTGRGFALVGCLLRARQCFSIKALSETLVIFIWRNYMALSCISLVFFSRFYQLKPGVWKGALTFYRWLVDMEFTRNKNWFCYISEEVPFGFRIQGASWILNTTLSALREERPVGNALLLVLELLIKYYSYNALWSVLSNKIPSLIPSDTSVVCSMQHTYKPLNIHTSKYCSSN